MNHKKPDVLVLNKSGIAVHLISWQKAMSLMFQESVRILDREFINYEYPDWVVFSEMYADAYPTIGTVTGKIAIPEIIILKKYDSLPTRDIKFSRMSLVDRDKHTCAYCGGVFDKKKLTIDHIIPRAQGGKTTWMNTITACFTCNNVKANRTPEQANMHLRFKPRKPEWFSPFNNLKPDHPCKSWNHFMDKVTITEGDDSV
jgi:5-methylcytosine-specific restriction endonuclease McrA